MLAGRGDRSSVWAEYIGGVGFGGEVDGKARGGCDGLGRPWEMARWDWGVATGAALVDFDALL